MWQSALTLAMGEASHVLLNLLGLLSKSPVIEHVDTRLGDLL
jgi:hypothetical protein